MSMYGAIRHALADCKYLYRHAAAIVQHAMQSLETAVVAANAAVTAAAAAVPPTSTTTTTTATAAAATTVAAATTAAVTADGDALRLRAQSEERQREARAAVSAAAAAEIVAQRHLHERLQVVRTQERSSLVVHNRDMVVLTIGLARAYLPQHSTQCMYAL
jgi:hypothetical protein